MSENAYREHRLSTASAPPKERLDAWCEQVSHAALTLNVAVDDAAKFEASLVGAEFAPLSLFRWRMSPGRTFRDRREVADGVAVYCLVRPRGMPVEMRCRGETRDVRPLEAALLITTEHSAINSLGRRSLDFSVDVIPTHELDARLPHAEAAVMRKLDERSDAFVLADRYREFMKTQAAAAKPDAVALMSSHLLDLIALALRPAAASALGESVMSSIKAGRLARALADIDARLTDPGLMLGAVAEAQGISARYLQMLFEEAGLTFSSYLIETRLAMAHAMLLDPARSQLTVAAISVRCGFADATHFSHAFKRRYGRTPRTVREDAADARSYNCKKPAQ